MSNVEIINGIKIETDGNVTHFTPIKEDEPQEVPEKKSIFRRIIDYFTGDSHPYIKVRDLANPFGDRTDTDVGCDGKTGIEIGWKFKF